MREIKFRAWTGSNLGYSYNDDLERLFALKRIAGSGDQIIFEQFTGLHDKNGKEIYEGDILYTNEADWIAKVIWNYDGFMLTGLNNTGFSCSPDYDKCEVIGNIHEATK